MDGGTFRTDSLPPCIGGKLLAELLEKGVKTEASFFSLTEDVMRAYFRDEQVREWIRTTRKHLGRPMPEIRGRY